jgi:hypothetical protein
MVKSVMFFTVVCVMFAPLSSWGAGNEAMKLRALNGLGDFTPPETFLNSNFIADELDPQYVFGKIKDFRKSRSCPTAWLIEEGQKERVKNRQDASVPFEYTLYLEEDCPGKVVYYVFVDRSQNKAGQWLEWRKVFHKSKTEEEYGAAGAALEQAAGKGFPVDAELRFVEIGGELILKKNEDFLKGDLKIKPLYDLKQGKAAGK